MVITGALVLAAAGAAGLTLASRDVVQSAVRSEAPAPSTVATVPVLQMGHATGRFSRCSAGPVIGQFHAHSSSGSAAERSEQAAGAHRDRDAAERAGDNLGTARAFSSQPDAATPDGVRRIRSPPVVRRPCCGRTANDRRYLLRRAGPPDGRHRPPAPAPAEQRALIAA